MPIKVYLEPTFVFPEKFKVQTRAREAWLTIPWGEKGEINSLPLPFAISHLRPVEMPKVSKSI